MTKQPDIHHDFAAWTANKWASLVPEADATSASVAIRFIRTAEELAKSHNATIKPYKEQGVANIADFRILGLLRHLAGQGIASNHIAQHLDFEPATVSTRLNRLEKHRHIHREPHPTNRRTHHISLNPASAPLVDSIYKALIDNHTRFFNNLTTTEHQQLATLLTHITSPRHAMPSVQ